jgi:hypothetical protein
MILYLKRNPATPPAMDEQSVEAADLDKMRKINILVSLDHVRAVNLQKK